MNNHSSFTGVRVALISILEDGSSIEMFMKLIAYFPRKAFSDGWYCFDVAVVSLSWAAIYPVMFHVEHQPQRGEKAKEKNKIKSPITHRLTQRLIMIAKFERI